MKITYTTLHDGIMKEEWESGEVYYYVEGIGRVSEEEAKKEVHRKNFEEAHKKHRDYLESKTI